MHSMFPETTLMPLSIAGAVMNPPTTFQPPAPLYNGFPGGSVGFPLLAACTPEKMCETLASDIDVGSFKLL